MRPIEPEGKEPQRGDLEFEIDETFRRLAEAEHAPDQFYSQVMARAANLPPSRQPSTPVGMWQGMMPRLHRAANMVLASVLLLCLTGLGYLYYRVGQMQTLVEQQQLRQHQLALEMAQLSQEPAAPQPELDQSILAARSPNEHGELSKINLEVNTPSDQDENALAADHGLMVPEKQPPSGVESILDHMIDTLQRIFEKFWDKVKKLTKPQPLPSQ
ncbi:hypothetical protein C2W62_30175 [Candidatus Entotheonella serta]|nr:hypothetical protein C2W62_30175 [Candidatus Entotheonella serta]